MLFLKGDAGAPLICKDKVGKDFLAGILSWGLLCGHPEYPGVYSHIKYFEEWLNAENIISIRSNSKSLDFHLTLTFILSF